jgi:hypothetical protein
MQRLVDLVVSAFTAHADAASNPFLNADAVVAAPAAVNTAVEPAVKSEKVRLPNPGKFSDYARESRTLSCICLVCESLIGWVSIVDIHTHALSCSFSYPYLYMSVDCVIVF